MLEAAHDISIYIHRFHNLDLFQQGWYHIKITMRWEDDDNGLLGTPSRILQYEEKTCSKIGKGKVSGSTSHRTMDIGKFVFRDCVHIELPDPGHLIPAVNYFRDIVMGLKFQTSNAFAPGK
ncbi:hypothetical protein CQW23_00918 [Capsicum baccatum]|uniref:Uncharacterized protein n=1 Tax=Capsicum baccatum TaxID=33114 RepID=A0A2G2XM36_CAPBA|nr:hypothetical protein CQW23_00918 [Capsicum baccatum]